MRGRLLFWTASLSLLAFGFLCGMDREWVALAVVLCRLLGLRELAWIIPVTLLAGFLGGPLTGFIPTHWPPQSLIMRAKFGENLLNLPSIQFLSLLLKISLWIAIYKLLRRYSRGKKLLLLHLVLFLAIGGLGSLIDRAEPVTAAILYSLLLSFCTYFFYLCYLVFEKPRCSATQIAQLGIVPFFESSVVPRPLLDIHPKVDEQASLDRRCAKVAFGTAVLVLTGAIVNHLIFGFPLPLVSIRAPFSPLPDLTGTGLSDSLFLVYPRWKLAVSVGWSSLHRITNHFALFAFIECCHLLLGYDVPRRFSLPFRANSFGDFYNAIMPYYVMLVNRLYLYPIYSFLRARRWKKTLAFDLALALGVFAAGLVTHLIRDIHLVALIGPALYVQRTVLTDCAYCAVLFLALRFGVLPKWAHRLPGAVKFGLWLVVFSLVLLCRMGGIFTPLGERFHFIARLLLGFGMPPG